MSMHLRSLKAAYDLQRSIFARGFDITMQKRYHKIKRYLRL
jgi:hypothetical protein